MYGLSEDKFELVLFKCNFSISTCFNIALFCILIKGGSTYQDQGNYQQQQQGNYQQGNYQQQDYSQQGNYQQQGGNYQQTDNYGNYQGSQGNYQGYNQSTY